MSETAVEVVGVTKRFGTQAAVHDASFTVRRGAVTALLGPNGAGKSTLFRIIVGFERPDAGRALVLGRPFRDLTDPGRRVGVMLDGAGFHPSHTARVHLRAMADMIGLAPARVDEVVELVRLAGDADRAVGSFSLGMRRRLALASALLGEPDLLLLDEPSNGLDPAGTRWLRGLLRAFAASGRTVLVSSHLLAEVEQTADDVVVLDRGRVITQTGLPEMLARAASVSVRTPTPRRFLDAMAFANGAVRQVSDVDFEVRGVTAEAIGDRVAEKHVVLHRLVPRVPTLEDVFLDLTARGATDDQS